jgi:L-alanine-DL-glutamate epimerase-like enolase superfamily enzyme
MKITEATIFCLRIPFVEAFNHSASARVCSDSIVVRVTTEDGAVGYGEGVARPYVTGETVESVVSCVMDNLWPAVARADFAPLVAGRDEISTLASISEALPDSAADGPITTHGAQSAVELALIDCLLRSQKLSLGEILPPKRPFVTYSGVITAGSIDAAVRHARYFKFLGIKHLKIKIDRDNPAERVTAIRRVVGPEMSLRVDANGAYDPAQARRVLSALRELEVVSAEQPIPRGHPAELAQLSASSPIPIVADESLITLADAQGLITTHACQYFNLRLSKCGGIVRTLRMARLAVAAGLRLQLGSHVGETAILSAAGRHVAAYLDQVDFVEGSYGKLLLAEDVAADSIVFGHGGAAPVLRGFGLGIKVREEILRKYAHRIIALSSIARPSSSRKGGPENVSANEKRHPHSRTTRELPSGSIFDSSSNRSATFSV